MGAPHKPQSLKRDVSGNRAVDESPNADLVGVGAGLGADAPGGSVVRSLINNTFKNPITLDGTKTKNLIDLEDYPDLSLNLDYFNGDGNGFEVRLTYGNQKDIKNESLASMTDQEEREDNTAAGKTTHEKIIHDYPLASDGVYDLPIKYRKRFVLVEIRDLAGAPTTAAIATSFEGQFRQAG